MKEKYARIIAAVILIVMGIIIAVVGAIVLTTMGAKKQNAAPAQPQVPQV